MSKKNTNPLPMGDILVVEDSKSDLKLLSEILRKESYRVRIAGNGELVLQSVQAILPDLILLDINIPGINGIEVCLRLKADPGTRDIPVVFLSAHMELEMKIKALEAGGVDYILKPVETSELLARINVHLNMYRLQRNLVLQSERLTTEIKDRKRAEGALKRSEEKYRLLAKNSVDVIWKMDRKLKLTYLSPAVYNLTGYLAEEWVDTYLYQHVTRREFVKMARQALNALKNYGTFNYIVFEGRMLKKNGEEFPVEIIGRVLLNDKGLPVGLQGSTRDITERKKVEEELAQYRENLEELVKERTAELQDKNEKLEEFNKLFVGREFRIKELRDKVKELEQK